MTSTHLDLFKELNPEALQKRFLQSLLKIQNVQRGSIWIKKDNAYVCVEAAGAESDRIKGVRLDTRHPSIVGWVIENKRMTVAETRSNHTIGATSFRWGEWRNIPGYEDYIYLVWRWKDCCLR